MAKNCCTRRCCSFILIFSGILLALSIVICILVGAFHTLIRENIDKNLKLKPGSESFKNWQSPSSPVYMQYFMFNVTNSKAVTNGSKPRVKQFGPYSYREIRRNVPVSFNNSADTINFLSQKAYVFDSATSCGGCNPFVDKFVTINIPLLKFSQLLVEGVRMLPIPQIFLPFVFDFINSQLLKSETVYEEKSVHELLWGYNDTLLLDADNIVDKINIFLKKFSHGNKTLHIPDVNPLIYLQSNNSNTSSEIYTGVGNIDRLGKYASYKKLRALRWWGTKWANMINGTDGSMFHPFVSKDDKLYCFVSDVCRSLYLIYDSTVSVRDITLYRYFTPPEVFEYTPVLKAGFCVTNNHTCVPDGLLDISVCQPMNVPIVVSLPHFLFANKTVRENVEGLHPNKEDHATFLSVEPNTGITMRTNKRIQINVAVDKVPDLRKLAKLRKVFLPVMFVNESACIDKHDADKFKKSVYLIMDIVNIGKYVVIGFGCLLLVIGLVLLRFRRKQTIDPREPSIQVASASDPDERSPLIRPLQDYIG